MLIHTHLDSEGKICYTYDNLSRVTKKTEVNVYEDECGDEYEEEDVKESFTYDAAGNVTGNKFSYDVNNRLIRYDGKTVSYDLDGNMLSDGTNSYAYDSANRLISAGNNAYTYNAEDVRIRNGNTTYVYNTNCKLSKLLVKNTNGVITKYVYGLGLIGEESNNTFKTYHFDYRGSTVAVTDATNGVIGIEAAELFKKIDSILDEYLDLPDYLDEGIVIGRK